MAAGSWSTLDRRWAPENVVPGEVSTHWRQEVAGTVNYSDQ